MTLKDSLGARSKAEVISYLLDQYEKYKENIEKEECMRVQMYRYNRWTQYGNLDQSRLRIHDFNGYLAYSSGSDNCRELDQGLCKLLNDDFGVCFDPAVYDKYNFFHVLEVYRDTERKKYLVYEQMVIQLNYSEYYYLAEEGWDECPFKLRRCNYVDDYSELVSKFRKYVSERELYDIGNIVGTSIGHDLELMDELF